MLIQINIFFHFILKKKKSLFFVKKIFCKWLLLQTMNISLLKFILFVALEFLFDSTYTFICINYLRINSRTPNGISSAFKAANRSVSESELSNLTSRSEPSFFFFSYSSFLNINLFVFVAILTRWYLILIIINKLVKFKLSPPVNENEKFYYN